MRKDHELVVHGVYRRIRHPMYAAIFCCLAKGSCWQNCSRGWAGVVTVALLYLSWTPREEKMMCEFFGDSYRDYMKRTGDCFQRL